LQPRLAARSLSQERNGITITSQARAISSASRMTFDALTREEYRSDNRVNKGP
jgi:hypothetical protein